MSHFINTTLAPMEGCDTKARLSGGEIPVVEFGFASEWHASPAIQIALGNHDDPEDWLRQTAAELLGLADQIAAMNVAKAEVSA